MKVCATVRESGTRPSREERCGEGGGVTTVSEAAGRGRAGYSTAQHSSGRDRATLLTSAGLSRQPPHGHSLTRLRRTDTASRYRPRNRQTGWQPPTSYSSSRRSSTPQYSTAQALPTPARPSSPAPAHRQDRQKRRAQAGPKVQYPPIGRNGVASDPTLQRPWARQPAASRPSHRPTRTDSRVAFGTVWLGLQPRVSAGRLSAG